MAYERSLAHGCQLRACVEMRSDLLRRSAILSHGTRTMLGHSDPVPPSAASYDHLVCRGRRQRNRQNESGKHNAVEQQLHSLKVSVLEAFD